MIRRLTRKNTKKFKKFHFDEVQSKLNDEDSLK